MSFEIVFVFASLGFIVFIIEFRFGMVTVETNHDWEVVWPGNTTSQVLGRPDCGWNGEYCDKGKNCGIPAYLNTYRNTDSYILSLEVW